MEFVGVLKSSLLREFAMKSKQEDFYNSATVATCVPSEDFSVDDLLDLSNPELEDGYVVEDEEEQEQEQEQEQEHEHEQDEEEKDSLSDSSSQDQADDENSNSTNSSAYADSDSHLTSGLAVPDDDLAELEWVSHLLDDSVSEFSLSYPAGEQKAETRLVNGRHELETRPALKRKARSKRARPTGRVWSFGSSSLNQSSPTTSSSTGFSSTPCLIFNSTVQTMGLFHSLGEPPFKKQKKKSAVQTGGVSGGIQFQRRCTHCQVQKTPQWRTGPLGAKTLCNACGVRYKSGRLYPEYRPACSPTFSGDIHSNSHRKVLEMRKRKETVAGPESGLMQMVQSF